ncbi:MAG: ABC transporter ATP-binding protein [Roseiflexaceae bacterium]
MTNTRPYVDLLLRYTWPLRRRVALLGLCVFTGLGLQLVRPQILRAVIDAAQTAGAQQLGGLTLLFLGAALVTQVVAVLSSYMTADVALRSTNALRADLAEHCLNLDIGFHNTHTPGEMIERIDSDVSELSSFLAQMIVVIVANGLLLLGILVLLFQTHWLIGLALTLFVALTIMLLERVRTIAVPAWIASQQAQAELYGYLEERLVGAQDLRALGAGPYVLRRFYTVMRSAYQRSLRAGLMSGLTANSTLLLFAIGGAVALFVSAYVYRQGGMTIGTAFMVFYYAEMLTAPITVITANINHMQQATAAITRIRQLMETRSAIQDGPGLSLPGGAVAVELDRVTFGYDPAHPVLHDLSLRVAPGRTLGLVGRTGHGKTTIARLLLGLYAPQHGVIRLDGQDIRLARRADLARAVGLVTQNVQLFAATVRDNITLFNPAVPDGQILRVIEELGLSAWYRRLPDGLDTRLAGDNSLSAGEAQLLALTRIFLRDPQVVVLDEASSRLDPATEALLEQALGRLTDGRTTIIIAHRLATVQRADDIAVIEQGRIVEYGSRAELTANADSHFASLLRRSVSLDEVVR